MSFNTTRGAHVSSYEPGHEVFNLKLIYSSNGQDDRGEHGTNLASRAVYCTFGWTFVRDILKYAHYMCHVCKTYKILFMISVRTIVMSLVGSQVIDLPLSKV